MPDHHGKRRRTTHWEFWIYLLGIAVLAVLAALAAITEHDARTAALAVLAVAGVLAGPKAGLFAAAPSALMGEWLIVEVAVAAVLASVSRGFLRTLPIRRPDDRKALAEALGAVPEDLLYALSIRAGGGPLSTRLLVEDAARTNPQRWHPVLGRDPGEGAWDGTVIDVGGERRATLFAAEAAGLAAAMAERFDRGVDTDLLALAACSLPLSAADEWIEDLERAVDSLLGAALTDVAECQGSFAMTDAGRDIARRAQVGYWARRLSIDDRELVDAFRFSRLPRFARLVLAS